MARAFRYWLFWIACVLALAATQAAATAFVVNSTSDTHDVVPGDGVCLDSSGQCSLRAALEEASVLRVDTIRIDSLPSPIFLHLGALRVTAPGVTLTGSGGASVVDGRFNPVGCDIFDILSPDCRLMNLIVANSRRSGIRIRASGAIVGSVGGRIVLVGNGLADTSSAAVSIDPIPNANVTIVGAWIGVAGNGTVSQPSYRGILVNGSSGVKIGGSDAAERNVIGNSVTNGIEIRSNASGILVEGNFIGLDVTGRAAAPNGGDGIAISTGANNCRIGGTASGAMNIVAGNSGNGIRISGTGTKGNVIAGNVIGLDSSGFFETGNEMNGICVNDGASKNRIGFDSAGVSQRLIVASNWGNGIQISGVGADSNTVDWCYVGTDDRGDATRANGQRYGQGILISNGARQNVIGGDGVKPRNLISGNYGPGVTISGYGTNQNQLVGNYIGAHRLGSSPQGNSAGVVVRDSAQGNEIGDVNGGNLISGNRSDLFPLGAGVVIFGHETKFNSVRRNLIGSDYTGTRTLRNLACGVVIGGGASHNVIGGDGATGNLISGNGTSPLTNRIGGGIHIFGDGTDSNQISGNSIGVGIDQIAPLPNIGHGIGIFGGATGTVVGGGDQSMRNIIAENRHFGIWTEGHSTIGHEVRQNSVFGNDSGGIALVDSANQSIQPPVLAGASADSVWGTALTAGAIVDIYLAQTSGGAGTQGRQWLGEAISRLDGSFAAVLPGLTSGDSLTCTVTEEQAGSSAFSGSLPVPIPTDVEESMDGVLPHVTLHQNYPNPFNNSTIMSIELPQNQGALLVIFNLAGQVVRRVPVTTSLQVSRTIGWDGTDERGHGVASGVYFYRLITPSETLTRKMILMK